MPRCLSQFLSRTAVQIDIHRIKRAIINNFRKPPATVIVNTRVSLDFLATEQRRNSAALAAIGRGSSGERSAVGYRLDFDVEIVGQGGCRNGQKCRQNSPVEYFHGRKITQTSWSGLFGAASHHCSTAEETLRSVRNRRRVGHRHDLRENVCMGSLQLMEIRSPPPTSPPWTSWFVSSSPTRSRGPKPISLIGSI